MKLNESCNPPNRNPSPRPRVSPLRVSSPRPRAYLPSPLSSLPSSHRHHPRYALHNHTSYWALDFNGQTAVFDHEQGAYYVAYLLLNPPSEPIHGLSLELKAKAFFRQFPDEPCETLIVDPLTNENLALTADSIVVERNLCVDEAEGQAYLRRKIEELEAILENDSASEPVKAEVRRELEEIYDYQRKTPTPPLTTVQKAVRSVRMAIHRFHENLAKAQDAKGRPQLVRRAFAAHLKKYLLVPTARYSRPGTLITREGPVGCFTYEPPAGVTWEP